MASTAFFVDAIKEGMTDGIRGLEFRDSVLPLIHEFCAELEDVLKVKYPTVTLAVWVGQKQRSPQESNFKTNDQIEQTIYYPSVMEQFNAIPQLLHGKTSLVISYYGVFIKCTVGEKKFEHTVLEYEFRHSSGRVAIKYGPANIICESEDELREALREAIRGRGIAVAGFMRDCQRRVEKLAAEPLPKQ